MQTFLLLIYLLYPPDTTNYKAEKLIGTFTDVIKKNNTVYLQFTNAQKKNYLFNAIKSETTPYVFYTTEPNGNIIVNPAIRNRRFAIQYKKLTSGGQKENWITSIREVVVGKGYNP